MVTPISHRAMFVVEDECTSMSKTRRNNAEALEIIHISHSISSFHVVCMYTR